MDAGTSAIVAAVVASLGIGGAVAAVINGLMQRRKIGADATVVVIAAARELVDPLRKELQTERAERAVEERDYLAKIAFIRAELETCAREAKVVRAELAEVRRSIRHLVAQRDAGAGS